MDAADFYKVSLSTIVKSGQLHRKPLADESERVFTPAGHPPDRGSTFNSASCSVVNAWFEDFSGVLPMKTVGNRYEHYLTKLGRRAIVITLDIR